MATAVFVDNLPRHCTRSNLHQLFSPFGTVVDAFIATHRSGESLGFGYVTFSSAVEANAAAKAINGMDLLGRTLVAYASDIGP
jgi:cold-inducible RNA-binding protein